MKLYCFVVLQFQMQESQKPVRQTHPQVYQWTCGASQRPNRANSIQKSIIHHHLVKTYPGSSAITIGGGFCSNKKTPKHEMTFEGRVQICPSLLLEGSWIDMHVNSSNDTLPRVDVDNGLLKCIHQYLQHKFGGGSQIANDDEVSMCQ